MKDVALPTITCEQLAIVRDTIAKNATKNELELFLYDCKRRGVHPLDRKIHFSIRKEKDGTRRYTPLVAIDFMRERADATGELMGIGEPVFSGKPKADDFTAKVTVKRFRHGQIIEFVGVARWGEFYPGDAQGFMWRKMPHNQLAKCAEAQALRKAFSAALAGIYLAEEFEMEREAPSISPTDVDSIAPDTWILATFQGLVPASGSHPTKVRLETDDGLFECDVFDLSLIEGIENGQHVRFQYTKNGKFRVLFDIEKIAVTPEPELAEEEKEEESQDIDGWETYALSKIESSGKGKGRSYTLEDANNTIVAYTQYPFRSCDHEQAEKYIGYDVYVKLTKKGDRYFINDMRYPEIEEL